jgi:zinc/manganese transport system permease protein
LSTALLIGPAAAALRLTRRVASAIGLACVIGVLTTWLGVLLAYDSYYWGSAHMGRLPVSFFVVALIFVTYLVSGVVAARSARTAARRRELIGVPAAGTEG